MDVCKFWAEQYGSFLCVFIRIRIRKWTVPPTGYVNIPKCGGVLIINAAMA
jgi:hypothetical protein